MHRLFILLFSALFFSGCARTPVSNDARTQVAPPKKFAFVNAPVADLLSHGPEKTSHNYSETRYHHLPCSYLASKRTDPARIHQLLLGQIVKVLEEKPYETLVEVPGIVIGTKGKVGPIVGWILSRSLTPIETLSKKKNRNVAFADPHNLIGRQKTPRIALIRPYSIHEANLALSAGTLLPLVDEQKNAFLTHIWDDREKQFRELLVPKSAALAQVEVSRPEAMRRMIGLLRYWANQKEGFIPYVLGGGSWTHNYKDKRFARRGVGNNLEYHRVGAVDHQHSGFDCTTLIYHAALITGIPYTCRNTTAIPHMLEAVKPNEPIEVGDIILYPGHATLISSLKPLKFIQSIGYSSGYGRVLEGPAEHYLSGIKTLDDLKRALKERKPLLLLAANKKLHKTQKEWGVYRFKSCWKKRP